MSGGDRMILDTVRIEILYEELGIGPGRLVPVDIKTAHIDSEDLLEVLRVLLRIEGYGSLDRASVPQNVDKLRSVTDPADQGNEKTDNPGSKSKSRSQKIVKKTKGSSKTMQCPYCEDVMNTRVIHGHCRNRHQDKYDPGYVTRYIKGIPVAAARPMPAAAADPPGDPGPSSDPNETLTGPYLRTNMHVKQVKAINGNKHDGIGVVQGRKGNMVEVQFGSGKYDRLPDVCLEAV